MNSCFFLNGDFYDKLFNEGAVSSYVGCCCLARAIEVIYERGVFKPLKPVDLPEGVRCVVVIEENIDEVVAEVGELIKKKEDTYTR